MEALLYFGINANECHGFFSFFPWHNCEKFLNRRNDNWKFYPVFKNALWQRRMQRQSYWAASNWTAFLTKLALVFETLLPEPLLSQILSASHWKKFSRVWLTLINCFSVLEFSQNKEGNSPEYFKGVFSDVSRGYAQIGCKSDVYQHLARYLYHLPPNKV